MTGYLLAFVIGISLGLLGGGGSILTVPTLAYVMNVEPKAAIAMSLPIVGLTSLSGALRHWRAGRIDLRTALGFGAVAMIGSYSAARGARLIPGVVQLTLLGVVMLVAAALMLRPRASDSSAGATPRPVLLGAAGLGVGVLTGLVGIGGGFLFVPALVLLGGVPMKNAVGTSLIVIALNTAAGAVAYRGQVPMDWTLVLAFTACAIVGSLVGARLVDRVSTEGLKRGFALFLIVMAGFVLWTNRAVLMNPGAALHPGAAQTR